MGWLGFKKGVFSRAVSLIISAALIVAMCYVPVTVSDAEVTSIDICTDTTVQTVTVSGTTCEVRYSAPAAYTTLAALASAGYDTFTVSYTVSSYTASSGDTAGVMAFATYGEEWTNNSSWNNLSDGTSGTVSIDLSSISTTDTNTVIFGIQFANITDSITFQINSAVLSGDGTGTSAGGSSSGSGLSDTTSTVVSGIDYNYAQLLQESLYFYDANMCGTDVEEDCDLSWRSNCHEGDQYVEYNGKTIDVSGGYHDAGDHVKFGLPQAYSASVLGMSYYQYGDAFDDLGITDHYKKIMDHFIEYFEKCTVLSGDITDSNVSVEAFCYQVGDGNTDHNYWGAPEDQDSSQGTRTTQALFTSESTPGTDIVCETAAALAIYSINFNDSTALKYAELLFEYANSFSSKSATYVSSFYESSSWEDDYALAAAWLYRATNDSKYVTYYNSTSISSQGWLGWVLSWDDVTAAAFLYGPTTSNINYVSSYITSTSQTTADNGFCFVSSWGSARYNCALQFMGLAYDSITGTDSFSEWAEGQMNYILGNNAGGHCFVVGYNDYSVKYPHHRAASGYSTVTGNGTTTQAHVLVGALVGGPKSTSTEYTDDAEDYTQNEVALDYQAGLVAAAAGLYEYTMANGTSEEIAAQETVDISEVISSFSQSGSSDGLRNLYSDSGSECNHVYDTPIWAWSDDYTSATATFTCTSCNKTQKVDATITRDVTTEATCTEAGECTYTATVTFDGTEYTNTTAAVMIAATGHSLVCTDAKDATCTEEGNTKYYTCSSCGLYFSDAAGTTEIKENSWITEATGHTWNNGKVEAEATCTESGIKTYTCTACDETKTETIDATGHSLVCTGAKDATCTEDGNSKYYTCSSCGLYFSDEEGTLEIEKDSWIKEATGHTWDEGKITLEATADTDGIITYTCSVCDEILEKSIDATGHVHSYTADESSWTWTSDEENGYTAKVTLVCSGTDCENVDLTAVVTKEITKEATCETAGEITYTAAVSYEGETYTATKTEEIEALGHTWNSGEVTKEATCTEAGTRTYTCMVCGDTKTEEIAAAGHNLVRTAAKTATCTESGNSEYYTCSSCGLYFSDAAGTTEIKENSWVITATGHIWNSGEVTKEATADEDGIKTYTCTVCGETYDETIAKTGDDSGVSGDSGDSDDNNGSGNTGTGTSGTGTSSTVTSGTENNNSGSTDSNNNITSDADDADDDDADDEDIDDEDYDDSDNEEYYDDEEDYDDDDDDDDEDEDEDDAEVTKGKTYKVGNNKYVVTNAALNGTGTVTFAGTVTKTSNVKIPSGVKINGIYFKVTAIGNSAFKNNKTITSVYISKNIKVIGKEAFAGCTKLETVKGGKNLVNIKAKAFANCTSLKKVTIKSKKLKKIGKKAFANCKKLKKVTLNTKKLKKVGTKAFYKTKATIKINVPNSKKKAYKKLFYKAGVNKKKSKIY